MTLDGRIASWNAGAERIFGYSAAEIVGKPIDVLLPEDRRDEEQRLLARLRHGERVEHFETVRVTKDGRQIDASLTVSPLRDATGRVIGASKIARDVTQRRRAEQDLAAARHDLSLQVQSLTRLHDLAMTLAASTDVDGALQSILETLVELHGGDFGLALIHDDDSGALRVAASLGVDAPTVEKMASVIAGPNNGTAGLAFETKEHGIIEDLETDSRFEAVRGTGAKSGCGRRIARRFSPATALCSAS